MFTHAQLQHANLARITQLQLATAAPSFTVRLYNTEPHCQACIAYLQHGSMSQHAAAACLSSSLFTIFSQFTTPLQHSRIVRHVISSWSMPQQQYLSQFTSRTNQQLYNKQPQCHACNTLLQLRDTRCPTPALSFTVHIHNTKPHCQACIAYLQHAYRGCRTPKQHAAAVVSFTVHIPNTKRHCHAYTTSAAVRITQLQERQSSMPQQ
jgi:hypothetical protein